MSQSQPLKPILDRIEQTLQSGDAVYVVGVAPHSRATAPPPGLPAPQASDQWRASPYVVSPVAGRTPG